VPALNAVAADGLPVLAISLVRDRPAIARWVQQHGLRAQLGVATGNLLTALRVDEAPSVVWVRDGRIVARASGVVPERFLRRRAALLRGP
jgi:hypothetical protein